MSWYLQKEAWEPQSRRAFLSTAALAAAAASTGLASGPAAAEAAGTNSEVGAVWWSELQTADPARARAFYAGVMGWTPKIVALADRAARPSRARRSTPCSTLATARWLAPRRWRRHRARPQPRSGSPTSRSPTSMRRPSRLWNLAESCWKRQRMFLIQGELRLSRIRRACTWGSSRPSPQRPADSVCRSHRLQLHISAE